MISAKTFFVAFFLAVESSVLKEPFTAKGLTSQSVLDQDTKALHGNLRSLVWSDGLLQECSESTISTLLLTFPEGVTSCSESYMEWDKDGVLSIHSITADPFLPSPLSSTPTRQLKTFFVATHANVIFPACGEFDLCALVDLDYPFKIDPLGGQFTYDCSNVYCGKNAKRDCNGNYIATECPAGTIAPAEIPTLSKVNCQRFQEVRAPELGLTSCGTCIETESGFTISCTIRYPNDPVSIVRQPSLFRFSELGFFEESPFLIGENRVVQSYTGPPFIQDWGSPIQFAFSTTLNGKQCDASICGYGNNNDYFTSALLWVGVVHFKVFQYRSDCSAIVPNAIMDQCEGIYSGLFAPFAPSATGGPASSTPQSGSASTNAGPETSNGSPFAPPVSTIPVPPASVFVASPLPAMVDLVPSPIPTPVAVNSVSPPVPVELIPLSSPLSGPVVVNPVEQQGIPFNDVSANPVLVSAQPDPPTSAAPLKTTSWIVYLLVWCGVLCWTTEKCIFA